MLKTTGNVVFENYEAAPIGGYNSHSVFRLDFMLEDGVIIIGAIKPIQKDVIYEYGVKYEVLVDFLDVDSQVILDYPILNANRITFNIMLGKRIIGHYETESTEYIK